MSSITGSCLCRQIRYKITGTPQTTLLCHCENCRKTTGSSFMANSFYLKSQLHILTGENVLKTYKDSQTESGHTLSRSFCSNCGSPLFTTNDNNPVATGAVIVSSGTMDLGPGKHEWMPEREFYSKSRREWLPVLDWTKKSVETE